MNTGNEQADGRETKPTMLWDGDCGFCFRWIQRWKKATGDAVEYRPYQEALQDFPQVDEAACREAVQLVLPGGEVLHAAHAVLKSLAVGGRHAWMLRRYERSAFFRRLTEAAYRFVARNRGWLPG
jgi:predicted DCC family thiol-disulfide oxidoreductase YuxK